MATQLTPGPQRWCDVLPATTAQVDCGGQSHRITWRRGKLVLEDHDLLAERSLAALGGELPVCVQVLDAWRRMRGSDLLCGFLFRDNTLTQEDLAFRRSRHETEIQRLKGALGACPPQVRPRMEAMIDNVQERERRLWEISLVEALPAALRRTLALSIIVKAERHWHKEAYRGRHASDLEDALTAIAAPLVERSARAWRRNVKPYASFVTEPRVLAPGEQPAIDGRLDTDVASVLLSLPLSWFTDIWVRGAALVDDCFVLCRTGGSPDEPSFPVLAVRWERQGRDTSRSVQAPAVVTRDRDGDRSLHWL